VKKVAWRTRLIDWLKEIAEVVHVLWNYVFYFGTWEINVASPIYLPRGSYFQEGEEVKLEMGVEDAYRKSIETVVNWIQLEVNASKTQVFFRTFAPVHFRFVKRVSLL